MQALREDADWVSHFRMLACKSQGEPSFGGCALASFVHGSETPGGGATRFRKVSEFVTFRGGRGHAPSGRETTVTYLLFCVF